MDSLYLLFCLAMIMFLGLVALLILSMRPGGNKESQKVSTKSRKVSNNARQSWIGFIGISLVIAVWTIWGALFFLAVVWILRQNPSPSSTFIFSDKEKNTARGIYIWLLVSPILTIPLFIALLFNLDDADRSLATMIPLIVHLPLLMGLTSKNTFLYGHAQQGILLIALRTGMSAIAISDWINPEHGIWIFLLGNGSLWLFGSVWGWKQISRGECWWMKQKGEKLFAPESAKADSLQMDKDLEDLLKSLNTMDKLAAKTKAINSFGSGTVETRKRAVEVLSKLGEVEQF